MMQTVSHTTPLSAPITHPHRAASAARRLATPAGEEGAPICPLEAASTAMRRVMSEMTAAPAPFEHPSLPGRVTKLEALRDRLGRLFEATARGEIRADVRASTHLWGVLFAAASTLPLCPTKWPEGHRPVAAPLHLALDGLLALLLHLTQQPGWPALMAVTRSGLLYELAIVLAGPAKCLMHITQSAPGTFAARLRALPPSLVPTLCTLVTEQLLRRAADSKSAAKGKQAAPTGKIPQSGTMDPERIRSQLAAAKEADVEAMTDAAGLHCGFDPSIERLRVSHPKSAQPQPSAAAAAAGPGESAEAAAAAAAELEPCEAGQKTEGRLRAVGVVQARMIKSGCVQKLQVQLLTEFLTLFPRRGGQAVTLIFASTMALAAAAQAASTLPAALPTLSANLPAAVASGLAQSLGAAAPAQDMKLGLVLPLRNEAELDALLLQIRDPQSASYHHYLSSDEFASRFGATQQDYDAVVAWARNNGLTVARTTPNRRIVDVQGSVATVNRALHVQVGNYQHPTDSRTFFAPDREPTMTLATPLLAIIGLTNVTPPHNHLLRGTSAQHMKAPQWRLTTDPAESERLKREAKLAAATTKLLKNAGIDIGKFTKAPAPPPSKKRKAAAAAALAAAGSGSATAGGGLAGGVGAAVGVEGASLLLQQQQQHATKRKFEDSDGEEDTPDAPATAVPVEPSVKPKKKRIRVPGSGMLFSQAAAAAAAAAAEASTAEVSAHAVLTPEQEYQQLLSKGSGKPGQLTGKAGKKAKWEAKKAKNHTGQHARRKVFEQMQKEAAQQQQQAQQPPQQQTQQAQQYGSQRQGQQYGQQGQQQQQQYGQQRGQQRQQHSDGRSNSQQHGGRPHPSTDKPYSSKPAHSLSEQQHTTRPAAPAGFSADPSKTHTRNLPPPPQQQQQQHLHQEPAEKLHPSWAAKKQPPLSIPPSSSSGAANASKKIKFGDDGPAAASTQPPGRHSNAHSGKRDAPAPAPANGSRPPPSVSRPLAAMPSQSAGGNYPRGGGGGSGGGGGGGVGKGGRGSSAAPTQTKAGFDTPFLRESEMHPSWQAKRKQVAMVPAQGKKMVFDD
ncbi:MAG: hypothetical protein WDW36_005637 [Sanguina aurantia]